MSERKDVVRLQITLTKPCDELIRMRLRRKGDLSKAVEAAIWLAYGSEVGQKPTPSSQPT
jgi:hypothetical protein